MTRPVFVTLSEVGSHGDSGRIWYAADYGAGNQHYSSPEGRANAIAAFTTAMQRAGFKVHVLTG
jgi:hypothetical protein